MTRGRLSPALATTSRIRAVGFCAARSRRSVLTDTAGRHHTTRRGTRARRARRVEARARSHHERSVARAKDRGRWRRGVWGGGGREEGRKKTKYGERERGEEAGRQQRGYVDNGERTRLGEGQGAFSAGGGRGRRWKKEDKPAPVPS